MAKKVAVWVEVRSLPGDFVSIDCGDFAITMFKEIGSPRIDVICGPEYEGDYWEWLCELDGLAMALEPRKIDAKSFKQLQYIAQGLYRPTQKQFLDLMARLFPESLEVLAD